MNPLVIINVEPAAPILRAQCAADCICRGRQFEHRYKWWRACRDQRTRAHARTSSSARCDWRCFRPLVRLASSPWRVSSASTRWTRRSAHASAMASVRWSCEARRSARLSISCWTWRTRSSCSTSRSDSRSSVRVRTYSTVYSTRNEGSRTYLQ